jgi:hypothetical protein
MSKQIPLTQGQFAIVDDEDYEELSKFKWHALPKYNSKMLYAARNSPREPGEKRSKIYMAIEIMKPRKGLVVDHINHNTLDNRKENLRNVTQSQNIRNCIPRKSASGFRGVSIINNKFRAQIRVNLKMVYLGLFINPKDAANAYEKAAEMYFGEFRYKEELCNHPSP